jgi:hypothetical protein
VATSAARASADPFTKTPAYIRPLVPGVVIEPLLTVGQQIPHLDTASETFRFVGLPDGIGVSAAPEGHLVVLVNHELSQSAGGPAGPLPSGARISELHLARESRQGGALHVLGGRNAIDRVWVGDPPVRLDSIPAGFAKFCSSFLADRFQNLRRTRRPGRRPVWA